MLSSRALRPTLSTLAHAPTPTLPQSQPLTPFFLYTLHLHSDCGTDRFLPFSLCTFLPNLTFLPQSQPLPRLFVLRSQTILIVAPTASYLSLCTVRTESYLRATIPTAPTFLCITFPSHFDCGTYRFLHLSLCTLLRSTYQLLSLVPQSPPLPRFFVLRSQVILIVAPTAAYLSLCTPLYQILQSFCHNPNRSHVSLYYVPRPF